MTKQESFLAALQRPVTLECGATVTLRAWGLDFIEQNASDYFAFLRLFTHNIANAGEGELGLPDRTVGLMTRVIRASLVTPEDAALVTVADLASVCEAIFEMNQLGDVPKKLIGLLLRATQAKANALDDLSVSSTS